MFERFTERARKVVVLAQEEAGRLRHNYIGTEHLLLGLVREEEGVAAQALTAVGVTLDGVRQQVETIVGYGQEPTGAQVPFTQRAKNALEASLKEAMGLRHNYIGTEHLLLGLLRGPEDSAAKMLSNLGADPEAVRREVMKLLGETPRTQPPRDLGPLGWAREALQRSFGRYPRTEDRASFEKFTGPARKVVVLAQDEARHFNHNYIGTEHLLLGLLREDEGVAAQALTSLNVTLDEVREQVESIVGYGEEGTGAQAPFTPRVNKVLQLAEREALQLDHDYISTEHVLLGLVRESEGVAARMLLNLDVDPDAVRREVIRGLPEAGREVDSLDRVELEMELEEGPRSLFRGRVGGIRTELALPRPLAVTVDADYVYRTHAELPHGSTTVEPGDVADLMLDWLRETDARDLEVVIAMLGERLLNTFPAMLEVSVSVSGAPEPADPPAPTFSVSSTFRR
ncbi:MAG: Clp protease N-terminal domain-containing protein [Rubrobacter sp.]